ncbi:hypothetical protein C0995_012625 [Termitomyces sp. Mi166|nr:hypothetical protein C0995_012625 [Termitomyces sp. Mi166\
MHSSDQAHMHPVFRDDNADSEDWKLNDLIYITLPPSSDVDGQTHCLIRRSALERILSTPGFPRRPHFPSNVCFRIGPSSHGLGMFATRDLEMGDHILTERPLTVTPPIIPIPHFASKLQSQGIVDDARKRAVWDKWEKTYLRPCFERLDPDQQVAFLNLANGHQDDGSGPILGVIRTNGLEPVGVADPEPHPDGEYAAVCKTMSRINHSPSADRLFDVPSFSFQLRATRSIKSGEEIFISYCTVLEAASSRQAYLASYGFTCTCRSCRQPTLLSDAHRLALRASIDTIDFDFNAWLADPRLAADHTIKISLHWISIIEEEALEASDAYRHHLHAIVRAYVALGDAEGAVKHGKILGAWALGQSGRNDILRKMESLEYYRGCPGWGMRICLERVDI